MTKRTKRILVFLAGFVSAGVIFGGLKMLGLSAKMYIPVSMLLLAGASAFNARNASKKRLGWIGATSYALSALMIVMAFTAARILE